MTITNTESDTHGPKPAGKQQYLANTDGTVVDSMSNQEEDIDGLIMAWAYNSEPATPEITYTAPPPVDVVFVDTEEAVAGFLNDAAQMPKEEARLYIDLEGVNLLRKGTISVVEIYIPPVNKIYIIDVFTLEKKAFDVSVPTQHGETLSFRTILEDDAVYTKVLFDLRNDSDALFGLFGISRRLVEDVQLMAYPTRGYPSGNLCGLAKCIGRHNDAHLDAETLADWNAAKDYGKVLFQNKEFEKYNERPMDERLVKYCANDVRFLPRLRENYWGDLGPMEQKMVVFETEKRLNQSQGASYHRHGAEGPRWDRFGEPDFPFPVVYTATWADYAGVSYRPYCSDTCRRYQGMPHHCETGCKCFEVCCRALIEYREPGNGKPAGRRRASMMRREVHHPTRRYLPYQPYGNDEEKKAADDKVKHLRKARRALRLGMTLGFGPTADSTARVGFTHWLESSALFRGEYLVGDFDPSEIDSSWSRLPSTMSEESVWEYWAHEQKDGPDDWVLVDDTPEWPAPPEGYVNVWHDQERCKGMKLALAEASDEEWDDSEWETVKGSSETGSTEGYW
ncbi:hypothetical protein GE09DRAFT_1284106 [Coniochaeta sp. 2T2.1]|nr:hypothetical protein GE09DRAFT_1284106 [Coniochaeta sp. 2T2.1]